ncbi:MAG: uncharacterized membrane protein YozB (DUF420 family) [Myxococcota bacterium]|jgi:uncharacterized membrane protein YozB (DUF420 family)
MAGPDQHPPLARLTRSYRVVMGLMFTVIFMVFSEPTLGRLVNGVWSRGRFEYVSTLSLDVHAALGFSFVGLVFAQLVLGYQLVGSGRGRQAHTRLGRTLLFAVIPVFLLGAGWVSLDRSTTIAPEVSVIFKHHRPVVRWALFTLIGFTAFFSVRAYLSIRRGDVAAHIDAVLGAIVLASGIAIIRFLYVVFWAIRGGSPFSVVGMYFLTVVVVFALLAGAYAAAGRLKQNSGPLALLVGVNLLLAVAGTGRYTFLDPADAIPEEASTPGPVGGRR